MPPTTRRHHCPTPHDHQPSPPTHNRPAPTATLPAARRVQRSIWFSPVLYRIWFGAHDTPHSIGHAACTTGHHRFVHPGAALRVVGVRSSHALGTDRRGRAGLARGQQLRQPLRMRAHAGHSHLVLFQHLGMGSHAWHAPWGICRALRWLRNESVRQSGAHPLLLAPSLRLSLSASLSGGRRLALVMRRRLALVLQRRLALLLRRRLALLLLPSPWRAGAPSYCRSIFVHG